jgi:hypothetical protein
MDAAVGGVGIMSGHFATIRTLSLAGLAALALATCVSVAPAAADSFAFSYSNGPVHGPRHFRHHRHHSPYWGPAYSYRYYGYGPPPVYYVAPPPVVYVPPPPAYGPSGYTAPVAAQPASPVYQAANGQYCREYQTTVYVAGQPQPSYGTACLQPDGVWRVVN